MADLSGVPTADSDHRGAFEPPDADRCSNKCYDRRMELTRRSALAALAAAAFGGTILAIDTREPAPKFRAKSLDGETFNNDSLKGKAVLLQFSATSCQYCRGDQPVVDNMVREFAPQGLVLLAVDMNGSKKKV